MTMKVFVIGISVAMVSMTPACVGSSTPSDVTSMSSEIAQSGDSDVEFNDADVMFAQMMIPHHEQAIEMADMALDPNIGASTSVRDLAIQIKAAQDPEIDQMTSLLSSWGESAAMDATTNHSSMMSGMLSVEDLDALGQLSGVAFDRAWLEAMIAHHEGAIEMADDVVRDGLNTEIHALAEAIISGQQTEIRTMRSMLEGA